MADDKWKRTVLCKDVADRERPVTVTITKDLRIVVTPPPGEAMVFAVIEVTKLHVALREAQFEVAKRSDRIG